MRAARLGLLAVLGTTLATPALAYVRTTTETAKAFLWPNPKIDVIMYSKDVPPYMSHDKLMNAARQAAAVWSAPLVACTSMQLTVLELDETDAPVAYDKFNRLTFRRTEWRKMPCDPSTENCTPYDSRALAITSVFAQKSDGKVLDADMEINAVNYKWADVVADGVNVGVPGEKVHDLQNTMTHEFGHLIGFDHNCYDPGAGRPRMTDNAGVMVPNCNDATPAMRSATMFNSASPLDVDKRDLTEDDQLAVCEVYPPGAGPVGSGGSGGGGDAGGGCSLGRESGGREAPGLVVVGVALGLGLAFRARRRRS